MRPTIDDLKMRRDGHLSAGALHPENPRAMMWPVVTGYGHDEDGRIVTVLRSFGPSSGEIEYGRPGARAVRFTRTEAGRKLFGEGP